MPAKCAVCGLGFTDVQQVVQLESADIIHQTCWAEGDLGSFLDDEVAKRCSFEYIHEDWKR
jgi:hypothetical protein